MVKGGIELLQDPVAQELLASRIPARLAYNWTDGTPRVVSIWFHWDGSDIVMASLPGAPKLKALQSGDRVAITIDTARVNLYEAGFLGNHCVVAASSFGSLIQTAVGSAGGSGGLRKKRSGWVAKAAVSTSARWARTRSARP